MMTNDRLEVFMLLPRHRTASRWWCVSPETCRKGWIAARGWTKTRAEPWKNLAGHP